MVQKQFSGFALKGFKKMNAHSSIKLNYTGKNKNNPLNYNDLLNCNFSVYAYSIEFVQGTFYAYTFQMNDDLLLAIHYSPVTNKYTVFIQNNSTNKVENFDNINTMGDLYQLMWSEGGVFFI